MSPGRPRGPPRMASGGACDGKALPPRFSSDLCKRAFRLDETPTYAHSANRGTQNRWFFTLSGKCENPTILSTTLGQPWYSESSGFCTISETERFASTKRPLMPNRNLPRAKNDPQDAPGPPPQMPSRRPHGPQNVPRGPRQAPRGPPKHTKRPQDAQGPPPGPPKSSPGPPKW